MPDLDDVAVVPQVGRDRRGAERLVLHAVVAAGRPRVVRLARRLELHRRERPVERPDPGELAHLAEGEDSGEERVLRDLRRRSALFVLPRRRAPRLGLIEDVVGADRAHSERAGVVGRLARDRRGGGELPRLLRGGDGLVVVLERVVLEVVLAQDPDAVDVPLEHVLELLARAADLDEHVEAIERPLAEPARLEAVGGLLEEADGGDEGVARLRRVPAGDGAAGEVEVNEGGDVGGSRAALGLRRPSGLSTPRPRVARSFARPRPPELPQP